MQAILPTDNILKARVKAGVNQIYKTLSDSLMDDMEVESVFFQIKSLIEVAQESAISEYELRNSNSIETNNALPLRETVRDKIYRG